MSLKEEIDFSRGARLSDFAAATLGEVLVFLVFELESIADSLKELVEQNKKDNPEATS